MGILGWIIGIGVTKTIINKIRDSAGNGSNSGVSRRSIPCDFSKGVGIPEELFDRFAFESAKSIRRIKRINVKGPIVYGEVVSQSGISDWSFSVDFNDYGRITGDYWIRSENHDSTIPKRLGNLIEEKILNYYERVCDL